MTSNPSAAEARNGPLGQPPTSAAKTAPRSTRANPSPGPGDREAHHRCRLLAGDAVS
jgi:hypothetical protein